MKNSILKSCLIFGLVIFQSKVVAQATPNPCLFPGVTCATSDRNVVLNSFDSREITYAFPERSMPFWLAIGDSVSGIIDTTEQSVFYLNKLSGPGQLLGGGSVYGYYSYFTDISFTDPGTYVLVVTVGGPSNALKDTLTFIVPPELDFCTASPAGACGDIDGNKIIAIPALSDVIPVDAVLPVNVGVIDSLSGLLDSTYSGTIYVEKLTGPGLLYGTLSMSGNRWFYFDNLQFSAEGTYTIRFFDLDANSYKEAILEVQVTAGTGLTPINYDGLMVYPNPFDHQVIVSSEHDLSGSIVKIFDISGVQVLSYQVGQTGNQVTINTSNLAQGVFFVQLCNDNSASTVCFKVIKR